MEDKDSGQWQEKGQRGTDGQGGQTLFYSRKANQNMEMVMGCLSFQMPGNFQYKRKKKVLKSPHQCKDIAQELTTVLNKSC